MLNNITRQLDASISFIDQNLSPDKLLLSLFMLTFSSIRVAVKPPVFAEFLLYKADIAKI